MANPSHSPPPKPGEAWVRVSAGGLLLSPQQTPRSPGPTVCSRPPLLRPGCPFSVQSRLREAPHCGVGAGLVQGWAGAPRGHREGRWAPGQNRAPHRPWGAAAPATRPGVPTLAGAGQQGPKWAGPSSSPCGHQSPLTRFALWAVHCRFEHSLSYL